jgi:hydroxypyruvate reductase
MSQSSITPKWKDFHRHLYKIREAALAAVDPGRCVRSCISLRGDIIDVLDSTYPLHPAGRIFVVGAGKAGYGMALSAQEVLGDRLTAGVVAIPVMREGTSGRIEFIVGADPIPTGGSIHAGKRIESLLKTVSDSDFVIMLISGGGSALLEYPEEGISLRHLHVVNELFLRSGAPINDINAIRRQISRIKGGGLGRMAMPAKSIALILSDVVGDPLIDIASGPTVQDQTSAKDALSILNKYRLIDLVPKEVIDFLEDKVVESSDLYEPRVEFVQNFVIGNNRTAAQAAATMAKNIGFKAFIVSTAMQGEAKRVGTVVGALLKCARHASAEKNDPTCLIFGGETTVTVQGEGVGGRNQEMALAAALELDRTERVAMMAMATDGVDGPTPAAGAIVTGDTIVRAQKLGIEATQYLRNNDSHSFFTKLGNTIGTGPTGTNVNDLAICLVY